MLVALATLAGVIACFIGSIYVAVVLAFVPQVLLLEEKSIGAAMKRSQEITLPEFLRVFGAIVLLAMVTGILSGGIQGLISGIFTLIPAEQDFAVQQTQRTMWAETLTSIVSLLLAPLSSIALTLLYYDLRVRREGFDIIARAEEVGYPLAPDPFGDISSEEVRQRTQQMRGGQR
jgi:hypothetical protein